MKGSPIFAVLLSLTSLTLPDCSGNRGQHQSEAHKITATSPLSKNVVLTEPFVCQIHSRRHIQVRAMEQGYLEAIPVKEGQEVKEGDVLFRVMPVLYKSKFDAAKATAQSAQLELDYSQKLNEKKVVSENEVALKKTRVLKAEAEQKLAEAELNFATVKAPFDGIVDRLRYQQGSLVEKGDNLTTLSDNQVMWVYFNVPEARYFEYMTEGQSSSDLKLELVLADGHKFNHLGTIGAIEADFDNATGNIAFRADFPNPDHLLRNGQTGTVVISRVQKDSLVIPQRSTVEILNKRCVYVVDKDNVVHQREIVVQHELDDIFVISKGVSADDKILLEGIRWVHDGDHVEYMYRAPEDVMTRLKYHAE